jgi:hypothetical protein
MSKSFIYRERITRERQHGKIENKKIENIQMLGMKL